MLHENQLNMNRNITKLDIKDLSIKQLKFLEDEIHQLCKKKEVSLLLQEKTKVSCPHCHSESIVKNGVKNDMQRYKCKVCEKSFNQLTGTPLARLRKKGRWLNYSDCLNKGYTLNLSAEITGVHPSTSFRWRHRFLKNCQDLKPESLNGITEIIDTYFYYSEKGRKNPSLKSVQISGKKAPKVNVQIVRDRYNKTYDCILGEMNVKNVKYEDVNRIDSDVLLCSEQNEFYKEFSKRFRIKLGTLKLRDGEYEKKKVVHIKNAYLYRKHLHDWMTRFKGVATRYLINYLSWFRELDEYKMNIPAKVILVRAKCLDRYPYHPLTL
jgi:transposase-like protein